MLKNLNKKHSPAPEKLELATTDSDPKTPLVICPQILPEHQAFKPITHRLPIYQQNHSYLFRIYAVDR